MTKVDDTDSSPFEASLRKEIEPFCEELRRVDFAESSIENMIRGVEEFINYLAGKAVEKRG
ncbi:MAG: hypothetical protein OXG44_01765 [Gammaproteobacteria bacterium]|nr:hypothetical protein [Gammaproteobacteria bacterium]